MRHDNRIKLSILEGKTTHLNDYRIPVVGSRELIRCQEQDRVEKFPGFSKKVEITSYKSECHESFSAYRENADVPFNLYWPDRHVSRISREPNLNTEKPIDKGKEESIKTRPRLYISPALSIDDVPDKDMRKLLIDFMYTTEWKKAEREATNFKETLHTKKDFPKGSVQKYSPEVFPHVPRRFVETYPDWDNKQIRATVDPTVSFWMNKDPEVICGACENRVEGIVPQEVRDEIREGILNNKLRLPHEKLMQGYAGYKPSTAKVVPLTKTDLPVQHPMLSTSQAITRRYDEDLKQ